jgi:NitT/TauT family transport system substrate-binding protein
LVRWLIVLQIAITAVVVTGCGLLNGDSAEKSAQGAENGVIRIGILATVDNAPVKVAEKRGFFREQGLDVEVKVFGSGPEAMDEVRGGRLDICLINYVSFFQAAANGMDGRVVADAYQATPESLVLMTRPDAGIREPKDLLGTKISVHAPGNINELLVKALLKANGLDPDGASYVPVKFPDIQAALDSKQIAAGVMVEPYISRAAQEIGATPALKIATGPTADMPLSGYVAQTKFAQDNPGKVAAFQRGLRKANDLANNDRSSLGDALFELAKVPADGVASLNLGVFPTSVDATRLQRVIDLMVTYGGLQPGLTAAELIVPMAS